MFKKHRHSNTTFSRGLHISSCFLDPDRCNRGSFTNITPCQHQHEMHFLWFQQLHPPTHHYLWAYQHGTQLPQQVRHWRAHQLLVLYS